MALNFQYISMSSAVNPQMEAATFLTATHPPVFSAANCSSKRCFTATNLNLSHRPISRISAVDGVSAVITSDTAQAEITWEIVLGALAGVTPFVVAGVEFSKRIVAQRKCKVCNGSGLVLRDNKYYFRCPSCGGFLPWQSWRRFFTG